MCFSLLLYHYLIMINKYWISTLKLQVKIFQLEKKLIFSSKQIFSLVSWRIRKDCRTMEPPWHHYLTHLYLLYISYTCLSISILWLGLLHLFQSWNKWLEYFFQYSIRNSSCFCFFFSFYNSISCNFKKRKHNKYSIF